MWRVRSGRTARPLFALAALVGLGLSMTWAAPSAEAECAEPSISLDPASAPAGGTVKVSGKFFFEDCYDPNSPSQPYRQPRRDENVRILFVQDDRVTELARLAAAGDGTFVLDVPVPADAAAGPARIIAAGFNGSPSEALQVGAPPTTAPPSTAPPTTAAPAPAPAPPPGAGAPATTAPGGATGRAAGPGSPTTTGPTAAVPTTTPLAEPPTTIDPAAFEPTTVPSFEGVPPTTVPSELALPSGRGSRHLGLVLVAAVVIVTAVSTLYRGFQRRPGRWYGGWAGRW